MSAAAIGLGLETQRVLGNLPDEGFVVDGDDDDAIVTDRVTTAILLRVEADDGAAWNQDVTVDDGAVDARVPPDANARHQDRLLDRAEAMDTHVGAEHAALNTAPRNDAAGR